jgi:hypothetical protein
MVLFFVIMHILKPFQENFPAACGGPQQLFKKGCFFGKGVPERPDPSLSSCFRTVFWKQERKEENQRERKSHPESS